MSSETPSPKPDSALDAPDRGRAAVVAAFAPLIVFILAVVALVLAAFLASSDVDPSAEKPVFASTSMPDPLPRADLTKYGEDAQDPQPVAATGDVSMTLDSLFGSEEESARYPFVAALRGEMAALRPLPTEAVPDKTSADVVVEVTTPPQPETPGVPGSGESIAQVSQTLIGVSVLVDAGHGIAQSPGVKGPTGLEEAELVLDVSKQLAGLLQGAGAKVYMTRETSFTAMGNMQRAELANKLDVDVFIRIHAETYRDPTASGVEALWAKDDSAALARAVVDELSATTGLLSMDSAQVTGFEGLTAAEVPTVQVSVGTLSNALNESFLRSEQGRERAAEGLYKGIVKSIHAR